MEEERKAALASFDSGANDPGARERGVKLLEGIYAASKDRPGVDLTPEVERLLEGEARLAQRREYLRYLADRDKGGRVFEDQLSRGIKQTSLADNDSASASAAWDELSLAYEIASSKVERRKVMASLEPFLRRMVFSGRYTPLLTSYTIKPGDSLTAVAAQFHTTSDALRRLNGLKADVIQPRQRLRILPGKTKLFVDKSEFTLWAAIDDRIFLEFPVGLGRDNGTPTGAFLVQVRQKDPSWWRPGEAAIPAGDPKNILGSRWLGFKETPDYAGFGIHGTSDPTSLGRESSAGCVRLRNEDIELLYDFVPYGTEVVIRQ
jgi:LysM repeat protein